MDPGKYIDHMMEAYEQHFRAKPDMKHRSQLQKGDHSKLDTTLFFDEYGKEIYQSLIGCGQWNIFIGRINTQSALMSMSRYSTAPREYYLERVNNNRNKTRKMGKTLHDRVKRIFEYLCRFKQFKLRF